MTSDWSPFAWQGIQIETPRAWELGAVTGDRRKGYFRLDDADMPRVEARWESGSPASPSAAVADRYLKKAGLAGAEPAQQSGTQCAPRAPADVETEFFVTRGDPNAMHMAARCRDCGRVALLRVFYRSDEPLQPVMARLFGSYRDHARDGKTPWSLFGLRFDSPGGIYPAPAQHPRRARRAGVRGQARPRPGRARRPCGNRPQEKQPSRLGEEGFDEPVAGLPDRPLPKRSAGNTPPSPSAAANGRSRGECSAAAALRAGWPGIASPRTRFMSPAGSDGKRPFPNSPRSRNRFSAMSLE